MIRRLNSLHLRMNDGSRWWVPCRCCPEKSNLYLTCSMCVSQSKITQTLTFIYSQQALHTFWYWKLPPHIRKALHDTLLASCMSTIVCARFIRWYLVYGTGSAKMLHGVVVYLVRRRPCAISNACGYLKSIPAFWTRWRWLRQYFTFTSRCSSQSDRTWKFPRGSLEHNRSHRPFVDDVLLGCLSGAT